MYKPKIVFSDFDGTLTIGNELRRSFFDVLDLCSKNNTSFVVVTGRPKSWAHFLLSHFAPLDWVITEGGGVISRKVKDPEGHFIIEDEALLPKEDIEHLEKMTKELVNKFPEVRLSTDTYARQTDRAIELSWLKKNPETEKKIENFFRENKVHWLTSNIHMNFWCGDVSKAKSIDYYLDNIEKVSHKECVFFGDSLNDESVFKHLPHTVGVSNIEKMMDRFVQKPSVILKGEENEGANGVFNYLSKFLK